MAKSKKLYALTEEHKAQLAPWRDKWIANALRTTPQTDEDRAKARVAIRGLYVAAKLPVPEREVFCASPITGAIAASVAAGVWWIRDHEAEARSLFGGLPTEAQLRGSIAAACAIAVARGMAAVRGEPLPPVPEIVTYAATYAATEAATRAAADAATEAATRAATEAATRAATYAATYAATDAATYAATDAATRAAADALPISGAVTAFLLRCCGRWSAFWQGGNQWSAWASYLSFFRHIAKLDLPEYGVFAHWEDAAIYAGPRFLHQKFWIASDFPTVIGRDEGNRSHSTTGPAIAWADGWAAFNHHGMRVPADIIEHPERITLGRIKLEHNAELRRVMIELYGLARFVKDQGAEVVHEDKEPLGHPRRLLRAPAPGDEPVVLVELTNSTPEPDGSHRMFHIRVHPQLRPIPFEPGGEFGSAQAMTCQNAVASLYGLRGEEYQPAVET